MKKLVTIAGALACVFAATQAQAVQEERWPRWYMGLTGGVSFLPDTDIKGASRGKLGLDTGGMGTVSLGYRPASGYQPLSNLRFEAELGYHYNSVSDGSLAGVPLRGDGNIHSVSYMGNLYYDLRNTTAWTPYVGAGAGGARVNMSRKSGLALADQSDNVFAYQFMAGIAYAPVTLPNTEWSLGYRYFVEASPKFTNLTGGQVKLDDIQAHNVEVGAKFRF